MEFLIENVSDNDTKLRIIEFPKENVADNENSTEIDVDNDIIGRKVSDNDIFHRKILG